MTIEFPASAAMQSQLAHQLLESSGTLGLARDVFQDCGIGEHGVCQLSAYRTRKMVRSPKTNHATSRRPRIELPSQHGELPDVIAVVHNDLPERSLQRACDLF